MVLVDQNKFPIQLAKLQANAYFKKQLAKCDATRFIGQGWGLGNLAITFGMLNEVEKAMKATTKEALEDCIEDSKVNEDLKDMPDHVNRMNQANKTFAVVPIYSKEDTEPENLSDFDSMAIKIGFDLFEKDKKKNSIVHLQWLVADIANEVAVGVAPIAK